MKYNALDWVAIVLVIVGALNWGLVGLFDYNLVDSIFGDESALSALVYILVGLAGVYLIYTVSKSTSGSRSYATTTRE